VWVIVVLVAFVALILLGGVGLFLALRTAADRVASNPPMPAVSIPASTPGQGPTLPAISGLTVSQVTTALQQGGYRCASPERAISTWVTSCSRSQNGLTYEVSLGGSTRTNVELMDAALIGVSRAPTDADAAQFFTQVMGAMGQGAGSELTAWIQQNLANGGDTSSGGLDLHLGRTGSDYVLVVSPG
jgi:hypothetical protein